MKRVLNRIGGVKIRAPGLIENDLVKLQGLLS